jgi:hypothetical protein
MMQLRLKGSPLVAASRRLATVWAKEPAVQGDEAAVKAGKAGQQADEPLRVWPAAVGEQRKRYAQACHVAQDGLELGMGGGLAAGELELAGMGLDSAQDLGPLVGR